MTGLSETTMAMEIDNMMMEETAESSLQMLPNPATSGVTELTISGYEGRDDRRETKIGILRITGEVVYVEEVILRIQLQRLLQGR